MKSMKQRGREAKNQGTGKNVTRRHETAYGDRVPICANTGCSLRKGAKCFGFEGCPGFKAR